MARISTYQIDSSPQLDDKVIGTDVNDNNITKNYLIGDIMSLSPTNSLTATKMFYGDAANIPAETNTLKYIVGGAGTIAEDTTVIEGTAVLDITHIDNDSSLAIGKKAFDTGTPIASIAIGKDAGAQTSGSTNSISIGVQSGANGGAVNSSICIGNGAGEGAAQIDRSIVMGSGAFNSSGNDLTDSILMGDLILNSTGALTTSQSVYIGASIGNNGSFEALNNANIAIGYDALNSSQFDSDFNGNTIVGHTAMTGADAQGQEVNRNISIGHASMPNLGGGSPSGSVEDNIAIGQNAGNGQSGQHNIAIGAGSGGTDLLGFFNVAVGTNALQNQAGGDFNVAIGNDALVSLDTGTNNTSIGKAAGSTIIGFSNTTNLGHNSQAQADNEVVLGDNNVTTLRCNTQVISGLSDARDKNNIEDLRLGLDFLMDLQPVSWDWARRDGTMEGKKDSGFIAQSTDKVVQAYSAEDILSSLVNRNNDDAWEMGNAALIPVLVKAIQELKAELDTLKK